MKVRKLPYYLRSLAALARALEKPAALARVALGRPAVLRFRAGPELCVEQPIDALVAKEVVLDDAYGLGRLRRPGCIVDVGAGIGDFCLAAALRFPEARVLAFEPHPEQLRILRENARRNGVAGLEIHPVAIGVASPRRLTLAAERARSSTRGSEGVEVEARRLSEYVRGPVELLKLDCEGAEVEALESLGEPGFARIARVVAEWHTREDRRLLEQLLERHGFHCAARPDRWEPERGLLEAERAPPPPGLSTRGPG